MPDQKKGSFERLIAAGGGQVVSGRCVYDKLMRNNTQHIFRAPYTNAPELTHMLTESKYLGKEKVRSTLCLFPIKVHFQHKVDYSGLAMRGVPVLKPLFLNDWLTSISGKIPAYETHMLDEARPHWEKIKRKRVVTDTPTNEKKKGRPSWD